MDKLEKVIKGLECCSIAMCPHILNYGFNKNGCPYDSEHNCIELLTKDALELLKEQRWIPITERLPKEKETVLLSDGYDVLYGYITTNRDFILVDEALSKDNFLIKSKKHWGISHWMPLPKIPKDGEQ